MKRYFIFLFSIIFYVTVVIVHNNQTINKQVKKNQLIKKTLQKFMQSSMLIWMVLKLP